MKKKAIATIVLLIPVMAMLVFKGRYLYGEKWFSLVVTVEDIERELRLYHPDVNAYNDEGFTGLMYAIDYDDVDKLRVLLEAGADPDLVSHDVDQATALILAVKNGDNPNGVAIVHLLLDHKADITLVDAHKQTALHALMNMESTRSRTEILKILLDHNIDCNAQDEDGNTLLHLIAERNELLWWTQEAIVLIGSLASRTIKNNRGMTPSEYADYLERPELADALAA